MVLQKQVRVRESQGRALARLRKNIAAIEQHDARFSDVGKTRTQKSDAFIETGAADFDRVLGGGIIRPALTEIYAQEARDAGALTGFTVSLLSLSAFCKSNAEKTVLWISTRDVLGEAGLLYGYGFNALGFDAMRLLVTTPKRLEDALWICEEAAQTDGLGVVVFDVRGHISKLDLRQTRRLHMRAQSANRPVFLLRQSILPQTSAAPQRFVVGPWQSHDAKILKGSALSCSLPGSIGPPGFKIFIDKNKTGNAHSQHILHWNADERSFYTASNSRTDFTPTDHSTQYAASAEEGYGNSDAHFVA